MRVGAFIVGAPRCGTYAWFSWLGQHPQVAASRRKEPNWFCADLPHIWRVKSLEEYHDLFAPDRRVALEASVLYLQSRAAPQLIRQYNPDAKIIILLRPLLQFLLSYHSLLRWLLFEDQPDLARAWALQESRGQCQALPRHCLEPATLQYAVVARFGEQLARYLDHFPAQQIRVLPAECWIGNPGPAYRQVLRFLELEDDARRDFPVVNAAQAYRSDRLASWLRYPPSGRSPLTALWRHLPRRRLLRWNTRPARVAPIHAELAQRVAAELRDDQALLRRLLPAVQISPP